MPKSDESPKRGMTTGLMLASAVAVLALPSAVLAFSNHFDTRSPRQAAADAGSIGAKFDSASPDASLAALAMRSLAQGHPFRFTPAGTPNRPDRSVTVAVRVDPQTASAITVRGVRAVALQIPPVAATQVHISPTAFTLGVSRGYESFAQVVTPDMKKIDMPDLATFKTRNAAPGAPSRFSPRIALDDKLPAGRAPRTFAGEGEDQVDLGGAYSVTRNIDVTAGVRYSRERDRLRPLTDGKQDNQAVYVGTEFRF